MRHDFMVVCIIANRSISKLPKHYPDLIECGLLRKVLYSNNTITVTWNKNTFASCFLIKYL